MRKTIAVLLTLVLILGLTACGVSGTPTTSSGSAGNSAGSSSASSGSASSSSGSASSSAGSTAAVSEISLWTYPIGKWGDEATVKTFTDAFEAQTGIKVNVEFLAYGGDGDNKINAAISASQAPDMVMEGPERLAVQWGAQGHMVDLSDMIDATDKAEITASTLEAFTIDGGILTGYPLCMNAHCMVINLDRFKAAGADQYIDLDTRTWTTEGFINAVKALNNAGNDTVAAIYCQGQGGDQGTRALVTNLYSGRYIDPARTAYEWDSEANLKALQLLKDTAGINFDPSIAGGDEQKLFRQGILDMAFCWNISAHKNTDDGNEPGKTLAGDEAVFMNFPSDDGAVELNGGIWGFGIFNNGDQARIDASKQFIKFVCDSDMTADAVVASSFFPARTVTEGNDLTGIFAGDDDMNIYNATIMPNLGDYYTITPNFSEVRTLWWNMLQAIDAGSGADLPGIVADYTAQANATLS